MKICTLLLSTNIAAAELFEFLMITHKKIEMAIFLSVKACTN